MIVGRKRCRSPSASAAIVVLVTALAGGLVAGGCTSDETLWERPDPRSCSFNWRVLFSPDQTLEAPFDFGDVFIRTKGDRVFVNPGSLGPAPAGIRSLPMGGGEASIVFDGWVQAFWLEDDQLLAVSASALERTPASGGSVETVLSLDWLNDINSINGPWVLDRDALYWARNDFVGSTLWRAPRDGSDRQQLATFPPSGDAIDLHIDSLTQLDDGRLVAVAWRRVFTIQKSDGALREATIADNLGPPLGIAPDGTMLLTQAAPDSDGHPRTSLVKQRVDDNAPGPPLLTFDALAMAARRATPDGNGGFYVLAAEFGTDGGIHATVWALDASNHLTRLACDPEIRRFIMGGAGTPDALYAVVWDLNSWQVVAVSRTP
jgi:hypothetical protein